MTTMKKRTAMAVTAGVWATVAGAAAIVMYDLNRPLHWDGAGGHFTTPLVTALAAGGWLALITTVLWWQRRVQVGHEVELVYARIRGGLSARMSRRRRPDRRGGGSS
jgi:hypothetical protein